MAESGYDPRRSRVSDNTMADFQRSILTGELLEVPGIGPAAKKKLMEAENEDDRITNTFQLLGKFLILKGPDSDNYSVNSVEHCEKFWHWLQSVGITSHRSAIVKAIAEKMNTMIPGIYDASVYDDDDDDE